MEKDLLPKNVTIEKTEKGFDIIATTGERTEFDHNGKLIKDFSKIKKRKSSFLDYFFTIGANERKCVLNWLNRAKPKTASQQVFLNIVTNAIMSINYDYMIATIEPTKDREGGICYKTGKDVLYGMSPYEWWILASEFQPAYNSELANLHELFLWYAYRVAMGYWTIEYVCDDSSGEGNYYSNDTTLHTIDKTGDKVVGGFADGIGNTKKLVRDTEGNIILCGGCYLEDGDAFTVAKVVMKPKKIENNPFYSGCVVLKNIY